MRYFSITSLGRQADRASLTVLKRVAAADEAQHVRIAAIRAIGDIGVANDADAVPFLATFTEASNDELAAAAARALGSVDAPSGGKTVGRARARIGAGRKPGVPSRLPGACRSTSRMTRRCASATKLFIDAFLFKAVERCAAS